VALRLTAEREREIDALDPDLRAGAGAIGIAVRSELVRMRPALARLSGGGEGDPDGELVSLDLDREGEPDPVSLVAVLAAHRAYVTERGHPHGVSLGALAIGRLLVWSARAAMLGPAPRIIWMGPPSRAPEPAGGQVVLTATARATVEGKDRRAGAVAVVQPS
jgi:hypothetical protein